MNYFYKAMVMAMLIDIDQMIEGCDLGPLQISILAILVLVIDILIDKWIIKCGGSEYEN